MGPVTFLRVPKISKIDFKDCYQETQEFPVAAL